MDKTVHKYYSELSTSVNTALMNKRVKDGDKVNGKVIDTYDYADTIVGEIGADVARFLRPLWFRIRDFGYSPEEAYLDCARMLLGIADMRSSHGEGWREYSIRCKEVSVKEELAKEKKLKAKNRKKKTAK